ncbi:tRNA 2-selenouridine synthase-like isoform X1 [Pecten maximus]|uniref:tRNA 2-selenouridine synthase-like isoform X1 n=1 Tax=Pecten maximus TaxID=6579 RepID=UPI00145911D9|nr:tRNA 2-selenouridine synthase-like isoform X1 [Pecten maximus]
MTLYRHIWKRLLRPGLFSSRGRTTNPVRLKSSTIVRTSDPFYREDIADVIDVRSPEEYQADHIPGAINLPVLSSEQFQIVGKLHWEGLETQKEEDTVPLKARLVGAKFSLQSIIHIIDSHFMDKPQSYSPLIYCKRGGLRSKSLATVLEEIGYPVVLLDGGYKTYRRRVIDDLNEMPLKFSFNVVTGSNKTGKSMIMRKLVDRGHQVLNFDKMIHYEDLFLSGDLMKMKNRSRYMETKLRDKLVTFDPSRPVWVKHQFWQSDLMKRLASTHNLPTPPVIYKQMLRGRLFEVKAPNEEKVERLVRQGYLDWMEENLDMVKLFLDTHAQNMYDFRVINVMQSNIRNNNLKELLSCMLMEEHKHYKIMRKRWRKKYGKSLDTLQQEFFVLETLTNNKIEEIVDKFENLAEK